MGVKNRIWTWIWVCLGIYVAGRTLGNIIRLYKAGGRVKTTQMEISRQEAEKANLEKKLAESQTDDFVERMAREKLGMGKPGEIVVVLDNDAIINNQISITNDKLSNWKKWRKLYLGF